MSNQSDYEYILEQHLSYWSEYEREMLELQSLYEGKYWDNLSHQSMWGFNQFSDQMIETNDAYKYVEQIRANLFYKSVGIDVEPDPTSEIEPDHIEVLINRWISQSTRADIIEETTKSAIIFPQSFLKCIVPGADINMKPEQKINVPKLSCLYPWEVILDIDSPSWKEQRYVGHTYWLPMSKVKDKFGKNKNISKLKPEQQEKYLERNENISKLDPMSDKYKYIRIIEFWDLVENKFIIWTPNSIQGYLELFVSDIPLTFSDSTPLVPIAPMFFSSRPGAPLVGSSTLGRVKDLIINLQVLHTYRANHVKQSVSKYLVDASVPEEAIVQFTSPIPNEVIQIDTSGLNPNSLFTPLRAAQLEPDFNIHIAEIRTLLDKSTQLPAFTRGEATNATATEVNFLNSFANNELGKMFRIKNQAIEMIAEMYVRSLYELFDDEDEIVVEVNGEAKVITKEDLKGSYRYFVMDGAISPATQSMKRNELIANIPTLIQLGANQKEILKTLIDLSDLPQKFLEVVEQVNPSVIPEQTPQIEGEVI